MALVLTIAAAYLATGITFAAIFLIVAVTKSGERPDYDGYMKDARTVACWIATGWLPLLLLTAYFLATWTDASEAT